MKTWGSLLLAVGMDEGVGAFVGARGDESEDMHPSDATRQWTAASALQADPGGGKSGDNKPLRKRKRKRRT